MPDYDIQAGYAVSTKLKDEEKWAANNVISFNEEELLIEVTLKPELLEGLRGKDNPVEIKVIKEDYLYLITGVVDEIIIDFPDRIKVKIEKLDKIKNNRSEVRYDVWLDCVIKCETVGAAESSLVTNISKSGMAVLSNQNLDINSQIFIDVQLGYGQMAKLRGKPIRKNAKGYRIEYGITFEPIDELNLILLNDYIAELEERNNNGLSILKKLREKIAAAE